MPKLLFPLILILMMMISPNSFVKGLRGRRRKRGEEKGEARGRRKAGWTGILTLNYHRSNLVRGVGCEEHEGQKGLGISTNLSR